MTIEITSTVNVPVAGREGHMPAGQPNAVVLSKVVDESAGIPAGRVVIMTSADPARSVGLLDLSDYAADVDALRTTTQLGSTTNVTFTNFAGANANKVFNPPRKVSLTTASDGDWDATTATVFGTAPGGAYLKGSISIANGGGTTTETTELFETVTSVHFPPQSGACSGTIGLSAATANSPIDVEGISVASEEQAMAFSGLVADSRANFADDSDMAVMSRGRIYVESENAAAVNDAVYVRGVAGVGESLGRVRSTPDSTDCLLLKGYRFRTASSGSNNLAEIERL
jgi:hypothetical protein